MQRPFDTSWLATPGSLSHDLFDLLELSDAQVVTWETGLSAVLGDYWDDDDGEFSAHLSRVFAVQHSTRGCCLIGGWFADSGDGDHVLCLCQEVSRLRGAAFAFTTQGRIGWHAWCAAVQGEISRRLVFDGHAIVDIGQPSPLENWHDKNAFFEDTICSLASELALGPDDFTPNEIGDGLLLTTSWGREHGVPKREI